MKAGGCSGFEYVFAWEAGAAQRRTSCSTARSGVRVWIDPRSHRLLDGTTLDYDTSLLSRGFVFQNPHAKSTCGCGTSFSSVTVARPKAVGRRRLEAAAEAWLGLEPTA